MNTSPEVTTPVWHDLDGLRFIRVCPTRVWMITEVVPFSGRVVPSTFHAEGFSDGKRTHHVGVFTLDKAKAYVDMIEERGV